MGIELRRGGIIRIRSHGYLSWRASIKTGGKVYYRQNTDRSVCEEWLEGMRSGDPLYWRGPGKSGRLRTGWMGLVRYGRMATPAWRAMVMVEGKTLTKQAKSREVVERWLRDTVREHPLIPFRGGRPRKPRVEEKPKPDHIRVLECCQTLRRRWRPDCLFLLVHGWDPRDIAEALGWKARRVRAALGVCVEKGCLDENLTPVGRGAGQRMERLYTRHRAFRQTGAGQRKAAV